MKTTRALYILLLMFSQTLYPMTLTRRNSLPDMTTLHLAAQNVTYEDGSKDSSTIPTPDSSQPPLTASSAHRLEKPATTSPETITASLLDINQPAQTTPHTPLSPATAVRSSFLCASISIAFSRILNEISKYYNHLAYYAWLAQRMRTDVNDISPETRAFAEKEPVVSINKPLPPGLVDDFLKLQAALIQTIKSDLPWEACEDGIAPYLITCYESYAQYATDYLSAMFEDDRHVHMDGFSAIVTQLDQIIMSIRNRKTAQ